jgi:hypothetical protein
MIKKYLQNNLFSFLLVVIFVSFSILAISLAWTEPIANPPSGNVSAPLNVGPTGQVKRGGLILNTGGAPNGLIVATGSVGIGTANPSYKLEVVGDVGADAYYYRSDIRLKENVSEIKDALEKILKLQGVNFFWKESGEKSIGLIAQDVEKIFPELVNTDNSGMKSIDYGRLTAVLIEGIKEQQKEIDLLKQEIKNLKIQIKGR